MPSDRAQGFRTELRSLRDQVLAAIDGAVLGDVEDGLDLYGRLLNAVLRMRLEYSVRANIDPPATWFNEHGREADWLESDLRAFVDRAWRAPNEDVLREIASRLTRFMSALRRAQQPGAHKRVLAIASTFYYRSLTPKNEPNRGPIGRSLLVSVRSYGEYQVLHDFEHRPAEQLDYARQVATFLAHAVQLSLDNNPERAPGAVVELRELLERVSLRRLAPGEHPAAERFELERYIAGYLVGLSGYVLMLRSKGKLTNEDVLSVTAEIDRTLSRGSTWTGILAALEDRSSGYPWSQWESQHWPDGQNSGTLGVLEDWIRVAAVMALARRGEAGQALPAVADLDPFEAEHMLKRMRDALSASDAQWMREAIVDPDEGRVRTALDQLAKAESVLHQRELDSRAQLPILDAKLRAFIDALEAEWLAKDALRGDLVLNGTVESTPTDWFGYNSLQSKDFFTESTVYASPSDLGQSIGRGLVRGESDRVIRTLDELPSQSGDLSNLKGSVDQQLDALIERGYRPEIVVVSAWRAVDALLGQHSFGRDTAARYRDSPLTVEYADHEPTCFVADLSVALRIQRWKAVPQEPNDMTIANDSLLINVREIDADYAAELLRSTPSLLDGPDGVPQNLDDATRRLRGLVHIRAWTKLRVELANPDAGYANPLPDDGD